MFTDPNLKNTIASLAERRKEFYAKKSITRTMVDSEDSLDDETVDSKPRTVIARKKFMGTVDATDDEDDTSTSEDSSDSEDADSKIVTTVMEIMGVDDSRYRPRKEPINVMPEIVEKSMPSSKVKKPVQTSSSESDDTSEDEQTSEEDASDEESGLEAKKPINSHVKPFLPKGTSNEDDSDAFDSSSEDEMMQSKFSLLNTKDPDGNVETVLKDTTVRIGGGNALSENRDIISPENMSITSNHATNNINTLTGTIQGMPILNEADTLNDGEEACFTSKSARKNATVCSPNNHANIHEDNDYDEPQTHATGVINKLTQDIRDLPKTDQSDSADDESSEEEDEVVESVYETPATDFEPNNKFNVSRNNSSDDDSSDEEAKTMPPNITEKLEDPVVAAPTKKSTALELHFGDEPISESKSIKVSDEKTIAAHPEGFTSSSDDDYTLSEAELSTLKSSLNPSTSDISSALKSQLKKQPILIQKAIVHPPVFDTSPTSLKLGSPEQIFCRPLPSQTSKSVDEQSLHAFKRHLVKPEAHREEYERRVKAASARKEIAFVCSICFENYCRNDSFIRCKTLHGIQTGVHHFLCQRCLKMAATPENVVLAQDGSGLKCPFPGCRSLLLINEVCSLIDPEAEVYLLKTIDQMKSDDVKMIICHHCENE